jgi:aspartate-semialdehyde dehydrogenase
MVVYSPFYKRVKLFKTMKNIAIIGATGLVGQTLISLLEKSNIPINDIYFIASKQSVNKVISFQKKKHKVICLDDFDNFDKTDIVFLCAGSNISKKIIHKLKNTYTIDLSSAFRMDNEVPLIIPEINPHALLSHHRLIASPNCTTTIMLMAIAPLHKKLKIKRIVASTYQAASGGGQKLIEKLQDQISNNILNLYLHDSALQNNNYSEEEMKTLYETRKILEDDFILVTTTCVRVPVLRSHSISVNIEFTSPVLVQDAINTIKNSKGITYLEKSFPTPLDANEKNDVLCGRIRQDISHPNCLEMWLVGDQLLKGAALNALQIAEML